MKSPLTDVELMSPNYTRMTDKKIDRITIHHMAGLLTAEQCLKLFMTRKRQASCNYAVGKDGKIGLGVDETNRSWCSSSSANDSRAITIETASDPKTTYSVPDITYCALLDLCVDICKRYGKSKLIWIPNKEQALNYQPAADEMLLTVHCWFAATACPGPWLLNNMGEIAKTVTERLNKETDDAPSSWALNSCDRAVKKGVFKGDGVHYNWHDPVTREALAVILDRLGLL